MTSPFNTGTQSEPLAYDVEEVFDTFSHALEQRIGEHQEQLHHVFTQIAGGPRAPIPNGVDFMTRRMFGAQRQVPVPHDAIEALAGIQSCFTALLEAREALGLAAGIPEEEIPF